MSPRSSRAAERDRGAVEEPGLTALERVVGDAAAASLRHASPMGRVGGARVHAGPAVERAARALGAAAFTMDGDVYLGEVARDPLRGRHLLAHELAHSAQQRKAARVLPVQGRHGDAFEQAARLGAAEAPVGNAVPGLQLLESREEQNDALHARTIAMFNASPEATSTDVLIASAPHLQDLFRTPTGPATRTAAARALVGIQRTLAAREASAPRGDDGALLRSSLGEQVPWLETRPQRLSEIRPFTTGNVVEWAAEAEARESRPRSRSETKGIPDPPFLLAPAKGARDAGPATKIGTTAKEHEQTPFELLADKSAGGPEVRAGLEALRGKTLGAVSTLIAERLSQSRRERGLTQEAEAEKAPADNTRLDEASGEIWFVSNRIYLLDRTGRIARGDFTTSLKGSNLAAGATYFYTPVAVKDSAYAAESGGLIRVDRGLEIAPPDLALNTFTVLDKLATAERGRSMGSFAIIVAESFGQDGGQWKTAVDLDPDKLLSAIHRSIDHLPYAISAEIMERGFNWSSEVAGELFGVGASYVAKRFPPLAIAMELKDAVEMGMWLGETASIAGHARSEDEIDFAAQAIARKLAAWLVDKAKAGLTELVKAGFGKAAAAIKSRLEGEGRTAGPGEGPPVKKTTTEEASETKAKATEETGTTAPAKKTTVEQTPSETEGQGQKAPAPTDVPDEPPAKSATAKDAPADTTQAQPAKQKELPKDWDELSKTERAQRKTPSGTPLDEDTAEIAKTDPKPVEERMKALRNMSQGELEQHLKDNPEDLLAQHALKEKAGPQDVVALPRAKPTGENERWSLVDKIDKPIADGQVDDLAKTITNNTGSKDAIPLPKDRVIEAPWSGKFPDPKNKGEYKSKGSSAGWKRDSKQFWSLWNKTFPDDAKLIGPGRTVTPDLAKKWGWPKSVIGQPLVHHHLGNGPFVIPLPESWHRAFTGVIHAKVEIFK